MNHISRVLIKGYKSLHNTETTFCEGLNVIIGANGSGKTNFVNALKKALLYSKDVERHEFYANIDLKNLPNYEADNYEADINLLIKSDEDNLDSRTFTRKYIKSTTNEELRDAYFPLTVLEFGVPTNISYFSNPEQVELTNRGFGLVGVFLKNGHQSINSTNGLFREHDLRVGEKSSDSIYFLQNTNEIDLKNILLNFFKLDDQLIQYLKNHTPIQDVRVNPYNIFVGKNRGVWNIYGVIFEFLVDGEWFRWNDLSDGTQRACCLVGTVYYENNSSIFIEEPELGIHPHQLQKLMEFVKEQSKEKQIIITTHSPEVLNHCITSEDLDRIIIAKMTGDGTKLYHLDEKQKTKTLKYLKNELSIADYWLHSDLEK